MSRNVLKRLWFKVAAALATVAGVAVGFSGAASAWDGNYNNNNNYDSHYQWCQSINWQHESCSNNYNQNYNNDDYCHWQWARDHGYLSNYNHDYDHNNVNYNVNYSSSYSQNYSSNYSSNY